MDVSPMEFTVDEKNWDSSGNRMASQYISIEKHVALKTQIDEEGSYKDIKYNSMVTGRW